jgi:single-strand DNA-binding protein
MEKIMITGHIGQDAQVRQAGKDECANFSVAVTRRFKQGDETKEATTWYNCALWRPNAVVNFLKKGQPVLVEGRPRCRVYQNRDGVHVAQMEIDVTHVELLGKNPNADAPAAAANATAADMGPLGDMDGDMGGNG